ncbi:MAG: alpha-L-fucosidase, partial [Planctomycetes bacterium]|nr:alpha-L-fucosidase [Planctomycetota bacterium]
MYGLLALAVVIAFGGGCTSEKHRPQKGQSRKEALQRWQDMKFGMFIHWGIYALAEGKWKGQEIPKLGEQIQRHASIPQDEYAELAGRFNPVKFDADEYVRIAKDAGMKYIVITSKHHDG